MARRGRRSSTRHGQHASNGIAQLPFKQPFNRNAPFEIASAEQINAIHEATLTVLEQTGINFLWDEARSILKQAGAMVEDGSPTVKFNRQFVMDKLKSIPASFTLHARNPEHTMQIGGDAIVVTPVASAPNCSNLDKGRVTGNYEDFSNLIKLAQSLNCIHMVGGYPVEPVDIRPNVRHLDAIAAMLRFTDKTPYCYALGSARIKDGIEMVKIARDIDEAQLLQEPSIITIVNANSPLQYDIPMLKGATEMCARRQPVIFTPFTLAGAMAPITIAGALVQQNAEALAGLVYSQCVNQGAPVVYGSFTSNVDMKTGSPAFGTPEYVKATIISGQLARLYNVPIRASNANASNAPDGQSVYESQMSLWACLLGKINIIQHGAGWLEGGLCASYEKMIIDAEMLQMLYAFLEPVNFDTDELAVDAIATVGAGNHYFQSPHTMTRYQNAFYAPMLSDWSNFENWQDNGSLTTMQRANKIWKTLLADYQAPPFDAERDAKLTQYINARKQAGGVDD